MIAVRYSYVQMVEAKHTIDARATFAKGHDMTKLAIRRIEEMTEGEAAA